MDIVPEGAGSRNALAEGAIARLLKQDPAPLMHKRNARLIEPANLEDDLGKLGDCDWIVEAVLEDLHVKNTVYNKINLWKKAGAAVTSNTSTIPLARLLDGMNEDFAAGFFITHFFNPPRYMRLLEIVSGPRTGSGRRSMRSTASAMSPSARPSLPAATRRASSPTASAATGSRPRSTARWIWG